MLGETIEEAGHTFLDLRVLLIGHVSGLAVHDPGLPSLSRTIVARHSPPGRTSIETVESGAVYGSVPNQLAKCSGSVQAFQTSSRGASRTRVSAVAVRYQDNDRRRSSVPLVLRPRAW